MCLINKVYTAQDMRDAAKCLFACEVDLKHDNRDIAKMLRQAAGMMDRADREAAAKREREATREYSSQVCNAAAMREALEKVRFYMPYFLQYMRLHLEDAEAGGYYERILEVVNAALSAPPRHCDLLSDAQEALAAIHEDRCYVNNPIDERRLTVNWLFDEARLFDEAKGEANEQK